jgi:hypothetical protein
MRSLKFYLFLVSEVVDYNQIATIETYRAHVLSFFENIMC